MEIMTTNYLISSDKKKSFNTKSEKQFSMKIISMICIRFDSTYNCFINNKTSFTCFQISRIFSDIFFFGDKMFEVNQCLLNFNLNKTIRIE